MPSWIRILDPNPDPRTPLNQDQKQWYEPLTGTLTDVFISYITFFHYFLVAKLGTEDPTAVRTLKILEVGDSLHNLGSSAGCNTRRDQVLFVKALRQYSGFVSGLGSEFGRGLYEPYQKFMEHLGRNSSFSKIVRPQSKLLSANLIR